MTRSASSSASKNSKVNTPSADRLECMRPAGVPMPTLPITSKTGASSKNTRRAGESLVSSAQKKA